MRNEERLHEPLRKGMRNYLELGIAPGSFLRAVLENDLMQACARADSENALLLADTVRWLYNNAPQTAWGSPVKVEAWLENFKKQFKD